MRHRIGLNFHGVGTPQRDLEPGEVRYWISLNQFSAILDRIVSASNPDDYILTFDDGNMSDYDIALPALVERNLGAVFFILSGRIGQKGSLGPVQIRELQAAGMLIGSHGIDHLAWASLRSDDLRQELAVSKSALEAICNCAVRDAGIPFGSYNAKVLRAIRHAGYAAAYSSDGGRMNPTAFLRPRTSVRRDMSGSEIGSVLAGNSSIWRGFRRRVGLLKRQIM
jgi:peptidoglycan/xylan/chitin deacetylase (PgdA/CDA1 family)